MAQIVHSSSAPLGLTSSNMAFTGNSQLMNVSFSFNSAAVGPGTNYVGFYVETQAGTIASMIPLFSTASQNSNALLAVSNGAQYGFYVENVQGQTDTYYFMNSSLNYSNSGSVSNNQHFALYSSPTTDSYFIGIENSLSAFNSMMLTATYQANPYLTDPAPQAPNAITPNQPALRLLD